MSNAGSVIDSLYRKNHQAAAEELMKVLQRSRVGVVDLANALSNIGNRMALSLLFPPGLPKCLIINSVLG